MNKILPLLALAAIARPTYAAGNGAIEGSVVDQMTQKVVAGVSQVATYVDATGRRVIDPYLLMSIDPADGYYPMAP